MTSKRNTLAIREMRKKDSESTREGILEAINQLKSSHKPINKSSVAKQAGCSRTTIYKHQDIMEQIEGIEARAKGKDKNTEEYTRESKEKRNDRLKKQYDRIKQLENDLHLAMIQLVNMEDLKRENVIKSETIERLLNQKKELEEKILILKTIREEIP